MKQAAIKDYWNGVGKAGKASNGIVRVIQHAENRSNSFEADGIFAVVGLNGAGKSCFFDFLTNSSYSRLPFLSHQIQLYDQTVLDVPGQNLQATIIDPSAELRESIRQVLAFRSLWGQQGLDSFKVEEVALLNYTLSTSYEDVLYEEVEVEESKVYPRFVVKENNKEFEFDALSLGEQLIFYIFWCLTKKYKNPGVFLIEEPESGLSPVAQKRIVDLFAYIASSKSKQIFFSTHSPFVVSRLGAERVLLMKKSSRGEWVKANQSNYLEELGMDLGCKGIIFLEDNKAKVFIDQLLSLYGSDLIKTYDLIYLGGESEVYEVVSRVDSTHGNIKIVGLLDGDQRGVQKYSKYSGRFYFLPGSRPPEEELLSYIQVWTDQYADALLVNSVKLRDAMRRCRGYNHHDFFEELSRELFDEVRPTVYQAAIRIWLQHYPNRLEIHDLIQGLDANLTKEYIDEVDARFPMKSTLIGS